MKKPAIVLGCLALAIGILGGCSGAQSQPELASSASQPGYATTHGAELDGASAAITAQEAELDAIVARMPAYPAELKDPAFPRAGAIYDAADTAGGSRGYVERMRELEHAQAFFQAEKTKIAQRVAGAVEYTAKEKGCDAPVGGAVGPALQKAVDKQVEERMRERNEAHALIDRDRATLGKPNAAALEKQADDIARASYTVRVDLVERKARLERLRGEASEARSTLEGAIQAERDHQAAAGTSDADKKASEARIAAMTKSLEASVAVEQRADEIERGMDERIQALRKKYEDALRALSDDVAAKAQAAPAAP